MMERSISICKNCGKRTVHEPGGTDLPSQDYRACSRCHHTVCSNCIDWTVGSGDEIVCSQCSGRTAPRQGGC